MKSKIVFLGLLIMCIFSGNAQKRNSQDWDNKSLVSSGTYFGSKITDSKWGNVNGKSYTSANYSEYSGFTYVKLFAMKPMNVALNYEVELEKGELEIEVVDSKNEVVFKQNFPASKKGSTNVDLKQGEDYQIRFNGKQAKGSYFCQWKEN
ncbi:MAG: hypothetical protein QM710_07400 [Flavobacterium sp.]